MKQVKDEKKPTFENSFKGNFIDAVAMAIISAIVYLVLDGIILRLLGYKVVKSYIGLVLFIIFLIVSVIYPTFMECKKGVTFGKKFSNMKIKIVEDDINNISDNNEINEDKLD